MLVPLQAAARGGARQSPLSNIFVFKSLQGWGDPSHTAQIARSFSKLFALFSHIAKKRHHHNIINITNLGNNFQYSMDRKVEVKNVFVMSTLTS